MHGVGIGGGGVEDEHKHTRLASVFHLAVEVDVVASAPCAAHFDRVHAERADRHVGAIGAKRVADYGVVEIGIYGLCVRNCSARLRRVAEQHTLAGCEAIGGKSLLGCECDGGGIVGARHIGERGLVAGDAAESDQIVTEIGVDAVGIFVIIGAATKQNADCSKEKDW